MTVIVILMVRFQVCSYQIGVSTNLRFALINPLNRQTRSGMLRNINKISLIVSLPSWLNLSLIYFLSISFFLFLNLRQFFTFALLLHQSYFWLPVETYSTSPSRPILCPDVLSQSLLLFLLHFVFFSRRSRSNRSRGENGCVGTGI